MDSAIKSGRPVMTELNTFQIPDSCHPKIKTLVDYWLSIHPCKGLPGRQHFDPRAIPKLLPNIWLLDVFRSPLRLRFRLFGTNIVDYAGEDNTGKWLDERWPEYDANVFKRVIDTKQPGWSRGPSVLRPEKNYYELERVRLPMARDGETVDMILALTVFFDRDGNEIV
jgi:hypothetical protein